MDAVLYIIAGPLFLISIAAHLYVKLRLRPKEDPDSQDYYYEFEPGVARYARWSKVTFAAAAVGVLLLFVATVV
ncbi:MAG: hypothetical protein ACYS74_17905 [Planctomycetota bacterium]|jgi:hypothetical protein